MPQQLSGSLTYALDTNPKTVILLIDEFAHGKVLETTQSRQLAVLEHARKLKCTVVEIWPVGQETRTEFRKVLDRGPLVKLEKEVPNAFADGTLEYHLNTLLKGLRNRQLLVMGFAANACVKATVGIRDLPDKLENDIERGATNRGYDVITSQEVLSDGPAWWTAPDDLTGKCRERITFYKTAGSGSESSSSSSRS